MDRSKKPLAVFTPILGRWAHDFVRMHIERILPGRTVVLAVAAVRPSPPCWDVRVPTLCVETGLEPGDPSASTEGSVWESIPAELRTRFSSAPHTGRVRRFLREHGVRVILAQWMHESLPLVGLAGEMGLPYYCQTHGTDITEGLKSAEVRRAYRGYNRTRGVVAPSEFGRRQLLRLGLRPDRAHVVRHPVSIPPRPTARPPGPVRCLAVGRLEPMKAPLLVVDAFRRALESCPDLRLDYVGDGSLRPALEQALETTELRGRVRLHGYLPNETVRSMMRRSHIFLHPSQVGDGYRYDTCPVAVAEAMAEGMAIVATRHGGIPEEVEDGESGLLVDEGDVRSIAEGLVNLASDAQRRTRLGEAAWRRARAMFAPARVRQSWLELMGLDEAGE